MGQHRVDFAQGDQLHVHQNVQQQEQQNRSSTLTPNNDHNCDILLNNFLIKKRRYRVLLKSDFVMWEAIEERGRRSSTSVTQTQPKSSMNDAEKSLASNVIQIDDIVAVTKSDSKTSGLGSPSAQFITFHYAIRVIKSSTDYNRWRVRTIRFYNADINIVQQWYAAVSQRIASLSRVRRLLVFINPYGGRQQGLHVYERYCKRLFQLAGIDASCIISQHANQIRDILTSHDLTPYDGVCCVGGDGTVAEVINGLIFRAIRDSGLNERQPTHVPKPALPIGIIPAGSTDTVAYSLHGTADVETAAIHVVLGKRRGLDICSVSNHDGILRFCASVLSYGYLGDVAAKSEKYRWMGRKRYEYTGVKGFLKNCGYDAEISVLMPLNTDEDHQLRNKNADTSCYADCLRCNAAVVKSANLKRDWCGSTARNGNVKNDDTDCTTFATSMLQIEHTKNDLSYSNGETRNVMSTAYSTNSNEDNCDRRTGGDLKESNINNCDREYVIEKLQDSVTIQTSAEERLNYKTSLSAENNNKPFNEAARSSKQQHQATEMSSSSDTMVPAIDGIQRNSAELETTCQWKVIKGSFFMISGANIACACTRSPNGISRYGHLGDGCLDLILVRKTSLLNNLRFAMNTMGRNGDIRDLSFVEVHRTRKFCVRTKPSGEAYSVNGSSQPITIEDMDDARTSSWNCDGEVVNELEITMNSHCQLIDVFMRGPFQYERDSPITRKTFTCCCGAT